METILKPKTIQQFKAQLTHFQNGYNMLSLDDIGVGKVQFHVIGQIN